MAPLPIRSKKARRDGRAFEIKASLLLGLWPQFRAAAHSQHPNAAQPAMNRVFLIHPIVQQASGLPPSDEAAAFLNSGPRK